MEAVTTTGLIDWAVAELVLAGQTESGDRCLVTSTPGGALVAVVDGLGHGTEAAQAAQTAVQALARHPQDPLIQLIGSCHRNLAGTRGVVMSVAAFTGRDETMTWLGVGNVEGLLLRARTTMSPRREGLLLRGGLVGSRLPALSTATVPVAPGDTLIFATDGVRNVFAGEPLAVEDSPQQLADHILTRWRTPTDDALVLVVRYLGRPA